VRRASDFTPALALAIAGLAMFAATTPAAEPGATPIAADRSLTGRPGDPRRGKAVVMDSYAGNCAICHAMPIAELPSGAFGDLGPSLEGVGSRLTVRALRQRVVDSRKVSPDTLMPPYFSTQGLERVQSAYAGKTILSAEQVEDVVAYLESLK
jgi:L-cysteine S-thiosulfotransferase